LANICSSKEPGRRATYGSDEKRRIAEASFSSSLPVHKFAEQQGVGYSSLTRWRRLYGRPQQSVFVPVMLTSAKQPDAEVPSQQVLEDPSSSATEAPVAVPKIGISLGNGRRIEVREDIPSRTLQRLLHVLEVS